MCVARSESVNYKICEHNGTVINNGRLNMGAEVIDGNFIHFSEIDVTLFTSNTDYYVTYWYDDRVLREQVVIFNAFIYRPNLGQQYNDYPFTSNWITQSELDKAVTDINSNTTTKATEIIDNIKTNYLCNKKIELVFCEEIPSPNPRNLFVGCEDYITEIVKAPSANDWTNPISEKKIYYWYDENKKKIIVGEEE